LLKTHTDRPHAVSRRVRGFTLIEVMIALAIAGLGLATLIAAAGTGLGNTKLADQYIEATRRAQSRLAFVGLAAPLTPGEQSGEDGAGFFWRARISLPVAHEKSAPGGESLPSLYTVEVTISWQSGGKVKSVTLQSQRLAPAPEDNG